MTDTLVTDALWMAVTMTDALWNTEDATFLPRMKWQPDLFTVDLWYNQSWQGIEEGCCKPMLGCCKITWCARLCKICQPFTVPVYWRCDFSAQNEMVTRFIHSDILNKYKNFNSLWTDGLKKWHIAKCVKNNVELNGINKGKSLYLMTIFPHTSATYPALMCCTLWIYITTNGSTKKQRKQQNCHIRFMKLLNDSVIFRCQAKYRCICVIINNATGLKMIHIFILSMR